MFTRKFFENNLDKFNAQLGTISDLDTVSLKDFENAGIFQDEANTDTTVCCIGNIMLFARKEISDIFIWTVIDEEPECGECYESEGMRYPEYHAEEGETV